MHLKFQAGAQLRPGHSRSNRALPWWRPTLHRRLVGSQRPARRRRRPRAVPAGPPRAHPRL